MEERLRKFAKVTDAGSYTRAAAELHISQPALSAALAKLERELGAQLLVRGKQPITLTRAGETAYAHAKALTAYNHNFKLELAALAAQKPLVTIGMIDSIASALLASGELTALESQAQVSLSVNNSRVLLRALERDELDSAFIATLEQPLSKTLHAAPLGSEPLIAVTTPERHAAAARALAHGTLPDFIGYDRQSRTQQLIRQHFARLGVELQPVFHSTSPEIILHMVRAGRGAAVLPYLLVAEQLKHHTLQQLAAPVARPITAVQRREKQLPAAANALHKTIAHLLARQNAARARQHTA